MATQPEEALWVVVHVKGGKEKVSERFRR
jgi:hypothetical protein